MGPAESNLVEHYDETRRRLIGLSPRENDPFYQRLQAQIDALKERVIALETMGVKSPKVADEIPIEDIILVVCKHEQIRRNLIIATRRTSDLCHARHLICYLAAALTSKSLGQIGAKLGKRDHTTIIHAYRKIEAMRRDDIQVDARLTFYEELLGRPIK